MSFNKEEFKKILNILNLNPSDLAQFLEVSIRTVYKWLKDPTEMPIAAEQTIHAWLRFHNYKLPWRPKSVFLIDDKEFNFNEQIGTYRNHIVEIDHIIQKVIKQGGPRLPWKVDLEKGTARLETIEVDFYKLASGGFRPASYRRTDQPIDLEQDIPLIEEAIFCIHQRLSVENQKKESSIS